MSELTPRLAPRDDAISAYRDALLRNAASPELARLAAPLDAETVAWLELFRRAQRTPISPDPGFVARLDQIIAAAPDPAAGRRETHATGPLRLARSHAVNGRPPFASVQALPPDMKGRHTGQMLRQFAAAALLVVLVAAALVAGLYPLRGRDFAGLPLFAPIVAPAATTLLDLTLSDITPFTAEGGFAITDYPPGGSSVELAGKESPEIFYVASGSLAMRVENALAPVRVIPAGQTEPLATDRLLAEGEEITLVSGTTVMLPEKAVVELVNEGAAPARMLDLLWATESYSTEKGGALWARASPVVRQEVTPPTSIVLHQTTLAAGASMPGSDSDTTIVSVGALPWTVWSLPDGSFQNASDVPVEVYVLTVTHSR